MLASRGIILIGFFCFFVLTAACTPTGGGDSSVAQAPEVFVFPGPTEEILISTEDIPQNNCDGSAEKSDTVEKSHTVLRTLELGTGISVDAGGQAGIPGVGQVGVGIAVATHYNVSYGSQDTVTRTTHVAAAAGTNILHTVRQYEIWETGEILVSVDGVNKRIPYRFRKDFGMKTLPPANLGCPGQGAAQPQPTTVPTPLTQLPVQPAASAPDFDICSGISAYPGYVRSEAGFPTGTSIDITVNPGEIHAITGGPMNIMGVNLKGGPDRGSVVIMLPAATYQLTGLAATYNWHGEFALEESKWGQLADILAKQQMIPGTCNDGDGCSHVDILVVGPNGVISQEEIIDTLNINCN